MRQVRGEILLIPQIAAQERAQSGRRDNGDGPAFDQEQFLLSKCCQRPGKRLAHGAEFCRQHALGHG